jgi:hypothetical protein
MINTVMDSEEILDLTRADLQSIADTMRGMVKDLDTIVNRQEPSPTPLKAILMRGVIQASIALIDSYIGTVPHGATLTHLDFGGERK